MKKRIIIGLVVIICILLICGCFVLLKNNNKKTDKVYIPLSNEVITDEAKKIANVVDAFDYKIVTSTPLGYIYEGDYSARGIITPSGEILVDAKKGYGITYNKVDDCYLFRDNKKRTLYCEKIDEEHKVFESSDRIIEKETEDGHLFYVVQGSKTKVYYYNYIDGYEFDENIGIRVFDNYIIHSSNLYNATEGLLDKSVTVDTIGDKYIIVDGDENVYLYNLQEHEMNKYKSYKKENGYYVFDKKVYIGFDGTPIEASGKDRRIINDKSYIDFSDCDEGFKVYVDNKDISDTCYTKIDIFNDVAYIGNDSYKLVVFNDGNYMKTDYYYTRFGSLIREATSEKIVFHDGIKKLNNSCDEYLSTYLEDVFICISNKHYYFVNSKLEKISDVYNKIECYENDVCAVYDGKRYGLAYGGKLITDVAYYSAEYIRDDLIILGRPIKDVIVTFENGKSDSVYKYQDVAVNIDVDQVIKEYKLDSIKNYINADKDMFKRYAYTVINNDDIKSFKDKILGMYNVIYENRESLDECYFLDNLAKLQVKVSSKLEDNIAAGLYYDIPLRIEILKGYAGSFYHEYMHFVEHRINKSYSYGGSTCYLDGKYTLDEDIACDRIEHLNKSTFLIEAGTEANTHKYFNKGSLTYIEGVNLYNIFAVIFGEKVMNDIFFANNSEERFFYELSKYGITYDEYTDFSERADRLTDAHNGYSDTDFKTIVEFVDKVYRNKNGHDWVDDRRFVLAMNVFVKSAKLRDKNLKGVKLTDKQLNAIKTGVNINTLVDSAGYYLGDPVYTYSLIDGKDYFTMSAIINKKFYYVMIEVNTKTYKGKEYKKYIYER